MPVRDYVEGNMRSENGTENSGENGEGQSKRRSARPARHSPTAEQSVDKDGSAPCSSNDTSLPESSSEPARETPVKSYRSKERGLKIYVEPTPQKSAPEPAAAAAPQENQKEEVAKEGLK